MRYFKATNAEETHHGLKYHDGINRDPKPWNPSGSCEGGGIYYADEDHICGFLNDNAYVREVFLLPESRVYPDPSGDKFKADILELGPAVPMQTWLDRYLERHHGAVVGNVSVYGTAKLEASALTSVGGDVSVYYGTVKLEAQALTSVGGGLRVYGTAKLEASALTSVGGDLRVDGTAKLEASALTSVGGNVSVHGTAKLEALTSVGGNVSVHGTAKLEALTSVGGSLWVDGTAKLDALTSVGGNPYSKKGESR